MTKEPTLKQAIEIAKRRDKRIPLDQAMHEVAKHYVDAKQGVYYGEHAPSNHNVYGAIIDRGRYRGVIINKHGVFTSGVAYGTADPAIDEAKDVGRRLDPKPVR